MKIIKRFFFGLFCFCFVNCGIGFAQGGNPCQWIKLNTKVPFVGDCIETKAGAETTQLNAFPRLMGGMMRLIMTIIMIMSLLMIVTGGVLMTTGGRDSNNYKNGVDMIKKVAYGMALLGASGVILKLINPNFFI